LTSSKELGDFDEDGLPDIAAAHEQLADVTVLLQRRRPQPRWCGGECRRGSSSQSLC